MEARLESSLHDLFVAKRFDDITRLGEKIAYYQPGDFRFRYCAAVAYVCSGQPEKGLSRLWGLLAHYSALSGLLDASVDTRLFVAEAALQLAQLAEFYNTKIKRELVFRYSDFAAKLAQSLGSELGKTDVARKAEGILNRHFPWYYCDPDGQEHSGFYSLPDSPYILQIEPTNFCNLKCSMCPQENLKRKRGFMEKSVFMDILRGWSNRTREVSLKHLVHENIMIKDSILGLIKLFFMGEPLLHPELDYLISFAQSNGTKVGLQTNGVLLSDERIRRKLLGARPYEIGVSIDGISVSTYEKVRAGARWSDVSNGIVSLFRERREMGLQGHTKIYITTIVTDDYLRSQELSLAFLNPIRPYVDGVVYNILNKSSRGGFFDLDGHMVFYEESPFIRRSSIAAPVCEEALFKLNVLWDGTVTACCYDSEGTMKLGDYKEGIDTVWNSPAASGLRMALLKQQLDGYQLCRSCKGSQYRIN